jgi:hypothetical protein
MEAFLAGDDDWLRELHEERFSANRVLSDADAVIPRVTKCRNQVRTILRYIHYEEFSGLPPGDPETWWSEFLTREEVPAQ